MRVYAYEVTRSALDTLRVGACVVDMAYDDDEIRSWELWSAETGHFSTGWVGVRRDRLCATCHHGSERHMAAHAHIGEHGPTAPRYEPEWLKSGREALTTTDEN